MDFANLDLKTASETGTWVHLEKDGHPLYVTGQKIGIEKSGKPCQVRLRGIAAKGVLDGIRSIERAEMIYAARLSRAKDRDIEAIVASKQEAAGPIVSDLIASAVFEWSGIIWDGKPLELTRENVLKICGPETYFFGQVYAEIMERHRLFKVAASA